MSRPDGKVAFITGGGRGQGRAHALTLAREGADIIVADIDGDVESVPYNLARSGDLEETVARVEYLDRRALAIQADVRSQHQLDEAVSPSIRKFGKIDILCANAVIYSQSPFWEMEEETWQDMIDTNLTGVFNSMRAVVPHMVEQNHGRIVATSSMAGRMGMPNIGHYVAAKWGVLGLVKTLAMEVAGDGITVNAICPTGVDTGMIQNQAADMIQNQAAYNLFLADHENPTREDAAEPFASLNAQPISWVEPQDISNAILFLVSDDARYITGEAINVAAGQNASNVV